MNIEPPPAGISSDDWAATPAALRQFIGAALMVVAQQQQMIAQQQQQIVQLQARVADLEARLKQHSQNSSKPPSADPPSAPARPSRPARGRKPGGQPGH